MKNVTQTNNQIITIALGACVGIAAIFFTYGSYFDISANRKNVITSISTSKHIAQTSLLKYYQPIDLIIENKGDEDYVFYSDSVPFTYHSHRMVNRNLPSLIGPIGIIASALYFPIAIINGALMVSRSQSKAKAKAKIRESILEPGQTIEIPAHARIQKTLFCPKEYISSVNLAMAEQHINMSLLKRK